MRVRVYTEEQRERNRIRELKRYHEKKNSESEKQRRQAYYLENKDHVIQKAAENYHDNRESRLLYKKQWKAARKEKSKTDVTVTFREILSSVKCRSKKLGKECNIDLEYLQQLWTEQQGLCKLSGLPMMTEIGAKWKRVSPDRIDSNLGYVKGNIQLVLASVNSFKMDMSQDEFIKLCCAIADVSKKV